ncbi:nuclear RNA polymerase D1B isoform X2 [Wolffia australiana]
MEEFTSPTILNASVREISFSLASAEDIILSCANDERIVHAHQLRNSMLGLPSEAGKCDACGTSELGECEGHFGHVILPLPVYHPFHVHELKNLLNLLCLKCLKVKKQKGNQSLSGKKKRSSCTYCQGPSILVNDVKTADGSIRLELEASSDTQFEAGFWNFMGRYGFRYGVSNHRPLLPSEALLMLEKIPEDTRKTLAKKGFYPQKGFIMQYLPVPPNCLHLSDYIDGKGIISSDISHSMLRRILKKIQDIEKSRSGPPNFESSDFESKDLQAAILRYMCLKGTTKQVHRDKRKLIDPKVGGTSQKQWLEKMRTLFIRKSSGYSSRAVITGDPYIGVDEIGLPLEVAMRVTFEERVTNLNLAWLQQIVDNQDCVTFKDGSSTYDVSLGPKGCRSLKVGQVVHRSIMDGDIVFINRPPTTHGHSLQALSVFVHVDNTVKINPLICAPLGADFDGDCLHVFYPQSYAAKAEARELFGVDQQLLSSHTRALNLQLNQDALLALKLMQKKFFLKKPAIQQLAMFSNTMLSYPALYSASKDASLWTAAQLLQGALTPSLNCSGERCLIVQGEIMVLKFERDSLQSTMSEILNSLLSSDGPKEVLRFYNVLLPLLMEFISREGFSICLKDFVIAKDIRDNLASKIEGIFPLLCQRSSSHIERQLEAVSTPVVDFIQKQSSLAFLVDMTSNSAVSRLVEQLGFIGLQLSDRGKLYSPSLVNDIYSHFMYKYQLDDDHCPTKGYGLIGSSFFHGLDPFEEMIHSIHSRELIIRSSSGLTEPGTLFKNLMSILRDVVLLYDGTVRNVCTNSILMFNYGSDVRRQAGKPVGILAATAISNPAYKAAVSSSRSTETSWELMKEVLLSKVKFKNDDAGRRVILYMNDCLCGKRTCKEKAACTVYSFLKKVTLRDLTLYFSIEYQGGVSLPETGDVFLGLMAHIHLDQRKLDGLSCNVDDIYGKCLNAISLRGKKRKKLSEILKKIILIPSWDPHKGRHHLSSSPCIRFLYRDPYPDPSDMNKTLEILAHTVCPILLETVIQGEVVVEVVVGKEEAKSHGDAWRVVLDCCLPVMHLLDTRRIIPYGINQIQDFLGISSAFDQSLQRLSTAVGHVSKGVLNEHFLVVTEAMTCSGRVMGFNRSSFKPLFRSLGIELPFAEATLQTPLKCFERAAEKCHKDLLTSVVAACSWGKPVAIGTGGYFEILWDKKKVAGFEGVDEDVYDFLNLINGAAGQGEKGTTLLGDDIDFIAEDEVVSSPELDQKLSNPVEDSDNGFDPVGYSSPRSDAWEKNSSAWNPSGPPNLGIIECTWGSSPSRPAESPPQRSDGWEKSSNAWNPSGPSNLAVGACSQGWGLSPGRQPENPTSRSDDWEKSGSAWNPSGPSELDVKSHTQMWGSNSCGRAESPVPRSDGWEKCSSAWNPSGPSDLDVKSHTQMWGSNSSGRAEIPVPRSDGWEKCSSAWNPSGPSDLDVKSHTQMWGSNSSGRAESPAPRSDGWEKGSSSWIPSGPSNLAVGACSQTWGSSPSRQTESPPPKADGWDKSSSAWNSSGPSDLAVKPCSQTWTSNSNRQAENPAPRSDGWEKSGSSWNPSGPSNLAVGACSQGWGSSPSRRAESPTPKANGWDKSSSAWNSSGPSDLDFKPCSQTWTSNSNRQAESPAPRSDGWEKSSSSWNPSGPSNLAVGACSQGWGSSPSRQAESPPPEADGWEKINGPRGSSRSPSPTWGSNSRRRGGSQTQTQERSHSMASISKWRKSQSQRKDGQLIAWGQSQRSIRAGLTPEEEEILGEVDPVLMRLRQILHLFGYKDGDRLSEEDQSYVLDKCFQYHPRKSSKVTGEVDYVEINKAEGFPDSRCFFVVGADGQRADFSYLKCMDNFVRLNYADSADRFCRKFFKRLYPASVQPVTEQPPSRM